MRSDTLPGVTGSTRYVQAARGYLARLAVALGMLAGLALAHGVQCPSGLAVMAIEQGASAGMALGAAQHGAVAAVTAEVVSHSSGDATAAGSPQHCPAMRVVADATGVLAPAGHGSPGLGGGLAACLAFIVAAAAVIVGLRPAWLRAFAPARPSRRGRRLIHIVPPQAASLAELCLLRT